MHGSNHSAPAPLSHAGMLASARLALRKLSDRIAKCRRDHQAYRELAAMSDRELEDIGLHRSDIDSIFAAEYDKPGREAPNVVVLERCRRTQPAAARKGTGTSQQFGSRQ